jgi:hypothetical protein
MYSMELLLESTAIYILLDRGTVEVFFQQCGAPSCFDKSRTYTPKRASAKLLDWSSRTSGLPFDVVARRIPRSNSM